MTDSTEPRIPTQPLAAAGDPQIRHNSMRARSNSGEQDALAAGTVLLSGALILQDVLSQSHFGITYRGTDTQLQRPVAVKEFFPDGCMRRGHEVQQHGTLSPSTFRQARTRFLDEARVLARFHHPNIVDVYMFFEENNTAYMVMEYLDGDTLLEVVNRRGRLAESEAVPFIIQAGQALEEVHRAHLLHCDVKPDNIIRCNTPSSVGSRTGHRVVLVDFGLSTRWDERANYLTRPLNETGHFGTPGYAPLEQYTQHVEFGIYTDVYALGATLYHLLTGETPTPSVDRAYGVDLVPPHELHEDISTSISDSVMAAMQLRAEQRPQTVGAFLQQLKSAQTRLSEPALPVTHHHSTPEPGNARGAQAPQVAAPPATGVLPGTENGELEEAGCLEAIFGGCITVWAIALVIYLMGFFIQATLIGSR